MQNEQIFHGVFVVIFNTGVLLTGRAGCGKSELALGLIDRGHQLVADDAVIFSLSPENAIIAHCPPNLNGLLAIRGLGVLNIKQLLGDQALTDSHTLHLIIHLADSDSVIDEPLTIKQITATIMQQAIPQYSLPANQSRHLPLLTEYLVRQFKLHPQQPTISYNYNNNHYQLVERNNS